MKLFVYFLLWLFITNGLYANENIIPLTINYQGRLIDNGALVSRQISLLFFVYDESVGGNLLLVDSNIVNVIDGLYSTYIGDNIIYGSMDNLKYATNVYINVCIDGTVLWPRERIASVMSALKTDIARTANNISNQTMFKLYSGTNLVGWGRQKP